MKKIFPSSFYNPRTFLGAAIAGVSFGLILFLMVIEMTAKTQKPYMGIIAFVILPSFLAIGLALIFYGAWRENRRRKAGISKEYHFPVIDLNDEKHRVMALIVMVGTVLFLVLSAFGSFKAYEYTDSDEFCGTLCHKVMHPEYTAYLNSPHAKVGCVKCHIGPGADWFVRAKISGSYQVYSVIFNKYSKPIPTPLHNLRPAQETCEGCHSPKHFYSEKKVTKDYYLSDKDNTHSTFAMLLRIGGGNAEHGNTSGIHWHMNIANKITYVSADSEKQTIPYIEVETQGKPKKVYKAKGFDFKNWDYTTGIRKTMDCIDCHNRPSHIYHEPSGLINMNIADGDIPQSLPFAKSVSKEALEAEYETADAAVKGIESYVEGFYSVNYPDIYNAQQPAVRKMIRTLIRIYSRNYFPEMKVSWAKFPNNIGHTFFDGCFRCHDGNHFDQDGNKLTNDCNVCHTIIKQGTTKELIQVSLSGLEYVHPVDIGEKIEGKKCTVCHAPKE